MFKMCDRDSFTIEIGKRFCELPYKHKLLFVSKGNHDYFNQSISKTKIIKVPLNETPDGFKLETMYSIY